MLGIIRKTYIVLLNNLQVYVSNHAKCVPLSNEKCEIQPINLHPNECSQELHCYTFVVKLDRYVGSYYSK